MAIAESETEVSVVSNWDRRFMDLALNVASWSKDPDCKVGVVIVTTDRRIVSTGYNGFPIGVPDVYNEDKEFKNALTVHAELNAILNNVTDISGCTLYATKAPCLECCKAIIQVKLLRVAVPYASESDSKWAESQGIGHRMLVGCGIKFDYIG